MASIYCAKKLHTQVGTIRANHPVPRKRAIYYYELTVINPGEFKRIAIGFAPKSHKATKQPGWEANSYGYHADDGKKFHNDKVGEKYADEWGAGSVVGAAIHMARREIFFTWVLGLRGDGAVALQGGCRQGWSARRGFCVNAFCT